MKDFDDDLNFNSGIIPKRDNPRQKERNIQRTGSNQRNPQNRERMEAYEGGLNSGAIPKNPLQNKNYVGRNKNYVGSRVDYKKKIPQISGYPGNGPRNKYAINWNQPIQNNAGITSVTKLNQPDCLSVEENQNNTENAVSCVQRNVKSTKSKNEKRTFLGFLRLKDLSMSENIMQIIQVLSDNQNEWKKIVENKPRPDLLFIIVQILGKISEYKEFPELQSSLFFITCCDKFIEHLSLFILQIAAESNKLKIQDFFKFLIIFVSKVTDLIPHLAFDKFKSLITMIELFLNQHNVFDHIDITKSFLKDLNLIKMKLENVVLSKPKEAQETVVDFRDPPDDFRALSVYPCLEDLECKSFLRPNLIGGSYANVNQYLDVQFRLMREDFIHPLRAGIKQFKESEAKERKKNHDVRIYNEVSFIGVNFEVKGNVLCNIINFGNVKTFKNIKWEHCKRFLYGSLLLFSNDNFRSFFLATVTSRDIDKLCMCQLGVSLVHKPPNDLFEQKYVMVESKIFFEPYLQVLQTLKSIETLPMEELILSKTCSPLIPKYLESLGNLQCSINEKVFGVFDDEDWPECSELGLNDSQYIAFQAALRKEFVLIQGPPGTGKTFLGLKIAEALKNMLFHNNHFPPIVVICYTNHALDQFLEGILRHTQKLIRFGGQSKNEELQLFNYNNFKKRGRSQKSRQLFFSIKDTLNLILKNHKLCELANDRLGIINFNILKSVISEEHLASFSKNKSSFQQWLLNDFIIEDQLRNIKSDLNSKKEESPEVQEEVDEYDENEMRKASAESDLMDIEINFHEADLYEIEIRAIKQKCDYLKGAIDFTKRNILLPNDIYRLLEQKSVLESMKMMLDTINKKLFKSHGFGTISMAKITSADVWELSSDERWALYFSWEKRLIDVIKSKQKLLQDQYVKYKKELEEVDNIEIINYLNRNRIEFIGMTTTGAAKNHALLCALKPKIVIVEEAAEVLEAHIIVGLTEHCEHLLLIGDQEQLAPKPATYELAKKYNLNISLFERMILTGVECCTLDVQHRMRPEIASLITPTIYPNLKNHSNVESFPDILGVDKNLFFIDHTELEEMVSEIDSHRNIHEANFVIAFCKYLLMQPYEPDDITILTTYSGQDIYLKKLRNNHPFLKGIKITVVDNYQGEENKIIILSLVRSNEDNKIGFLSIKNRVCVALSRAKYGFFMIGNMACLCKGSKIWNQINDTLQGHNAVGPCLTLKCQNHGKKTIVSNASDFAKAPEGGCLELCNLLLNCGHSCKKFCHMISHDNYKCFEKCERNICPEEDHFCPLLCHQTCELCIVKMERTLICGHVKFLPCHQDPNFYKCSEKVEVTMPTCGHKIMKPCCIPIEKYACTHKCDNRLPCGHSCVKICHTKDDPDHLEVICRKACGRNCKAGKHLCTKLCHEICNENCPAREKKILPCGHYRELQCHVDIMTFKCEKPCTKNMPCTHKCKAKCYQPCDCKEKVNKTIPECGHSVKIFCIEPPSQSQCRMNCNKTLDCGHKCTKKCNQSCVTECKELVPTSSIMACNHRAFVECYFNKDFHPNDAKILRNCQAPCGKILPCKDMCSGTCGECMQGRIHKSCFAKCGNILICGHSCSEPCRENCPPCKASCRTKCEHSKCPNKCGVPCKRCIENCGWRCEHFKCSKLCGEQCDRPPCDRPCSKILNCKHPCVGLCGEPCPTLCRICNRDELTEIFFGNEDDETARFIQLQDCNHVFEASGIDMWVDGKAKSNEISFPACPKCTVPIQVTKRYGNAVKRINASIVNVKERIFGQNKKIKLVLMDLASDLKEIKLSDHLSKNDTLKKIMSSLNEHIRTRTKGINEVNSMKLSLNFIKELDKQMRELKYEGVPKDRVDHLLDYIDTLLYHLYSRMFKLNETVWKAFLEELKRIYRIINYYNMMGHNNYKVALRNKDTNILNMDKSAFEAAFSIELYTESHDLILVDLLEKLKKALNVFCALLTKQEFDEIQKAMQSSFHSNYVQGHWFECPNRHIYCITECGGAMEVGKCPECGSAIGGQSHALLGTNRVSSISGATHAAYSDAANMANYNWNDDV